MSSSLEGQRPCCPISPRCGSLNRRPRRGSGRADKPRRSQRHGGTEKRSPRPARNAAQSAVGERRLLQDAPIMSSSPEGQRPCCPISPRCGSLNRRPRRGSGRSRWSTDDTCPQFQQLSRCRARRHEVSQTYSLFILILRLSVPSSEAGGSLFSSGSGDSGIPETTHLGSPFCNRSCMLETTMT